MPSIVAGCQRKLELSLTSGTARMLLAAFVFLLAFDLRPVSAQSPTKNILVFGDSLTWGWNPNTPSLTRYSKHDRWTEVMARRLGDGFDVVTEGLSGRTTVFDDPHTPDLLRGADHFTAILISHEPLDLVIIQLGTNDTKAHLGRSAAEISLGMEVLVKAVTGDARFYPFDAPEVLIVSPPQMADNVASSAFFRDANKKILAISDGYAKVAERSDAHFFDAGSVISKDELGSDGVHLSKTANEDLGLAVAEKVLEIFE